MSWICDDEKKRWICRIMAISFRIAKEQLPGTISRSWVAKYINRSEDFVKRNWCRDPFECGMGDCRPHETRDSLSQESKDIILQSLGREKKSLSDLQDDIERIRGKRKHRSSIHRYLNSIGAKSFHQTTVPKLSEKNVSDRMWFCDFLSEWDVEDFLFLAPSDEFYIYETRKTNFQNDRIWALNIEDIPHEIKTREIARQTRCVGIFLLFTSKRMMWVIKEGGQSWDGVYFRNKVIIEHVIPFFLNRANVMNVKQTTFLHDKAPCMSALATQSLLKANKIDFFGNDEWPGSSPDLNPCENLGAIVKDRVERHLLFQKDDLDTALARVLSDLEFDTQLFLSLLESYPARLDAVRQAGGRHTKY